MRGHDLSRSGWATQTLIASSSQAVWHSIRERIGEHNFTRWVAPLELRATPGGGVLEAPDRATRIVVERHFLGVVKSAFAEAGFPGELTIAERDPDRREGDSPYGPASAAADMGEAATADPEPAESEEDGIRRLGFPDYTFANFVVGESNRVAFESARSVAENVAGAGNPLVLHGGVGLGKTHLAIAIAHALSARGLGVVSVTAEELTRIAHDRDARVESWYETSMRDGALIVDDVQLLAEDGPAEIAFFRLLDRLLGDGRPLVLTCDKPPADVPALARRLAGLATPGVAAEILPPDLPLRRAILARKAELLDLALPADVRELIAGVELSSVRALEGILNRAAALASLARCDLSMAIARRALPAEPGSGAPPSIDAVVAAVAAELHLAPRALRSRRRDHATVLARQIAIYVARRHASLPLAEIAADLGCRDHSAAVHAAAAIVKRLGEDPALADRVARIEARLGVLPAKRGPASAATPAAATQRRKKSSGGARVRLESP